MKTKNNSKNWIIKLVINTIFFIVIIVLSSAVQAEPPNLSGHIITRKGQTIDFIKLGDDHYKYINFKYGNQNKETTIHLSKVKTITFGEESESALIVLKDGRKVDAQPEGYHKGHPEWNPGDDGYYDNHLLYYYFDDVAQKERSETLKYDMIAKIVMGENAGRLRQCPHCNSFWPDSYLFCPHDGEKTEWAN